jgi:hypothetical protein
MTRPVPVGLVAFLVLASALMVGGSIVPATAGPAGPATDATSAEPRTAAVVDGAASSDLVSQETQNFDTTTFEITVHDNGSATWTFRHEQRFANEDNATRARENFEAFAEEFRANETGLYDRFINQSRGLAETGAQETGREMQATDFRRSVRIEEQFVTVGVVEMSFTWENFAVVEEDTVRAGDVFDGIPLASDQAIVYRAGDGLTFRTIEPDDGEYAGDALENAESVRWSGDREFIDGRPRAVFDRSAGTAAGGADTPPDAPIDGVGPLWYLLGGILVTGLGIAAVVWYRRSGPAADGTDRGASSASTATAAPDAHGASDAADPIPDGELMTDEDRVVALIRENGGRMKQVNIVEETDWSKSKVSMLLSDMEDEGTISKLRVGRENIISLEGFEPEATKSPFEE